MTVKSIQDRLAQGTPAPPQAMQLLRQALSFSNDPSDLTDLRMKLLSSAEAWEFLFEASINTRLVSALLERLELRGLLLPAPKSSTDRKRAPADILKNLAAHDADQRSKQHAVLIEIIGLLNAENITPVLIKGARHLWLGEFPWRTMIDLDILIPNGDEQRAFQICLAHGFTPDKQHAFTLGKHHLPGLFRPDLPGCVELHRKASAPQGEQHIRTEELLRRVEKVSQEGKTAGILNTVDHVWHAIVHHHFSHSGLSKVRYTGFARGEIGLKGLYEVASALSNMGEDQRAQLFERAAQNSVALSGLDLWLAASVVFFGVEFDANWRIQPDALAAAKRNLERAEGKLKSKTIYPGYVETFEMSWDSNRLSRLSPRPALGNTIARLNALNKLATQTIFRIATKSIENLVNKFR